MRLSSGLLRRRIRLIVPLAVLIVFAIAILVPIVFMLVSSIKNPNEERVREFVDRIITGRSGDRQLDDCDLTLKELDLIGEVVTRRVVSTLHTRVAYPATTHPDREVSNVIPLSGGQE